jgi:hypothetical protein
MDEGVVAGDAVLDDELLVLAGQIDLVAVDPAGRIRFVEDRLDALQEGKLRDRGRP